MGKIKKSSSGSPLAPKIEEIKSTSKGRWVTINGTHVFISTDGYITKGPVQLAGKTLEEASQIRFKREKWQEEDYEFYKAAYESYKEGKVPEHLAVVRNEEEMNLIRINFGYPPVEIPRKPRRPKSEVVQNTQSLQQAIQAELAKDLRAKGLGQKDALSTAKAQMKRFNGIKDQLSTNEYSSAQKSAIVSAAKQAIGTGNSKEFKTFEQAILDAFKVK